MPTTATTVGLFAVTGLVLYQLKSYGRPARAPPGPPGKPFVGNLFDMSKTTMYKNWEMYGKWSELYGPITSFHFLGRTIVVLEDGEAVKQLFWARNKIHSNRVDLEMIRQIGWSGNTGVLQPGDELRTRRRLMACTMGPEAVKDNVDAQQECAQNIIQRLLDPEADLWRTIRFQFGQTVMLLTYGYEAQDENDQFLRLAEEAQHIILVGHRPNWLVNILPFVRFIPAWFPFQGWKRQAQKWRRTVKAALNLPFEWARGEISRGTARPSFASRFLEEVQDEDDKFLDTLKATLATLYTAGVDSTVVGVHWTLVVLALFPDIQARAQAEVDSVINGERLPTYEDRPSLPFVNALLKEIYRWTCFVQGPLPHVAAADDEYKGYFIPKGAMIWVNTLRMMRNPKKYPNPLVFDPGRFLGPARQQGGIQPDEINEDPGNYIYGYGPRQCPGRYLADLSIWLVLSTALATVNVSRPVAANGAVVTPETLNDLPGNIRRADVKSITLELRSAQAGGLLDVKEQ